MSESNTKKPLIEREAGNHEGAHVPVFQVPRQLLQPPGREFFKPMGDQTRALGEELARLGNDLLAPSVRPNQFSCDSQDTGGDSLFETTGEQESPNVLGGT
jgi:hypothetical protein